MSCNGCELKLDTIFANEGASIATANKHGVPGDEPPPPPQDGECHDVEGDCVQLTACDPYTQRVTFTANDDNERCKWEMAPLGTSGLPGEQGRAIPPQGDFFAGDYGEPDPRSVDVDVDATFTAGKFTPECGKTAMMLRIYKPNGTVIAGSAMRCTGCSEETGTAPPGE